MRRALTAGFVGLLAGGCSATLDGTRLDATAPSDATAPMDAHVKNRPPPPPTDASQVRAPRPIAPLSSSWMVGNAVPLRWRDAVGATRVEVCEDRACTRVEQTVVTTETSLRPAIMTAGAHFWRLSPASSPTEHSPTWMFFIEGGARNGRGAVASFVHDYDGDGWPDLAVADPPPRWRHVHFHSNQRPGFEAFQTRTIDLNDSVSDSVVEASPAGDMNGDGLLDLLVVANQAGNGTGIVEVFPGGAQGPTQQPLWISTTPHHQRAEAAGDLDADGYADVLVRFSDRAPQVFYGGPAGAPQRMTPSPELRVEGYSEFEVRAAGDVDGDARGDLLFRHFRSGVLTTDGRAMWPDRVNFAFDIVPHPLPGPRAGGFTHAVVDLRPLGDVNGNGTVDLLVASEPEDLTLPDAAEPWRAEIFTFGTLDGLDAMPRSLGRLEDPAPGSTYRPTVRPVGDVNADGYDDLSLVSYQGTTLRILYGGAGFSQTSAGPTLALPNGFTVYTHGSIGDQDGDGIADVCVVASELSPGGVSDGTIRQVFFFRGSRAGVATRPTTVVARMP